MIADYIKTYYYGNYNTSIDRKHWFRLSDLESLSKLSIWQFTSISYREKMLSRWSWL